MDGAGRQGGISIVVTDDHPRFRHALTQLVEARGDFVVVGEAPDGASAVRLARERKPAVVLMDLHMPGMGGVEATAEVAKLAEPPAVIVLTASSESTDVLDAIAAGAAGYLLKGASAAEIRVAIEAALDGNVALSPEVTTVLLDHVRELSAVIATAEPLPPLTERETQMLELIALGRDNKAIAEELFLALATVKSNIAALFEKLGVDSRAQAAVLAVRARVV